MPGDKLITASKASRILQVSVERVRELMRDGSLRVIHSPTSKGYGKKRLVSQADVMRLRGR